MKNTVILLIACLVLAGCSSMFKAERDRVAEKLFSRNLHEEETTKHIEDVVKTVLDSSDGRELIVNVVRDENERQELMSTGRKFKEYKKVSIGAGIVAFVGGLFGIGFWGVKRRIVSGSEHGSDGDDSDVED